MEAKRLQGAIWEWQSLMESAGAGGVARKAPQVLILCTMPS